MQNTWGGKSTFTYVGSVQTGTDIAYGQGQAVHVSGAQYKALRDHFLGRVVPVGLSRTLASNNSLGAWLQENITRTAIASYVAPILVIEGYAERVGRSEIRVTR